MFDPTFPALIRAVTNGASALIIAMETKEGNQEVAPKSANDGLDCLVKTRPVIKPVSEIKGRDL